MLPNSAENIKWKILFLISIKVVMTAKALRVYIMLNKLLFFKEETIKAFWDFQANINTI